MLFELIYKVGHHLMYMITYITHIIVFWLVLLFWKSFFSYVCIKSYICVKIISSSLGTVRILLGWTALVAHMVIVFQVPVHQTLKDLLILRAELQKKVEELKRESSSQSLFFSSEHSPPPLMPQEPRCISPFRQHMPQILHEDLSKFYVSLISTFLHLCENNLVKQNDFVK